MLGHPFCDSNADVYTLIGFQGLWCGEVEFSSLEGGTEAKETPD